MNKEFDNSRKTDFLSGIPQASLDSKHDLTTVRCKFNFHYMDFTQSVGQKFSDWKYSQLKNLLDKFKIFSREPLTFWENERGGSGNNNWLEIYGNFPLRSKFTHPKFVPHQARWGRFRIGDHLRLIGFTIPLSYNEKKT